MWSELKRIIKPNGAIVLFGSEPFSSALRMSNIKQYKYDWVWQKQKPTGFYNCKKQPLKDIETISVFYDKQSNYYPQNLFECNVKSGRKSKNGNGVYAGGAKEDYIQKLGGYPRQVLKFDKESKSHHPTQKPVALLEYLIKTYTQESETVLDFTMGSGSTIVSAQNTNRKAIGIEMDEGYFNIAVERINMIVNQPY